MSTQNFKSNRREQVGWYFYDWANSAFSTTVVTVFLGPYLTVIAQKKVMLAFFAYVGAFSTMGLYFLEGDNYMLGAGLFLIANLSFGASIVFYNAFLLGIGLSWGWSVAGIQPGICTIWGREIRYHY